MRRRYPTGTTFQNQDACVLDLNDGSGMGVLVSWLELLQGITAADVLAQEKDMCTEAGCVVARVRGGKCTFHALGAESRAQAGGSIADNIVANNRLLKKLKAGIDTKTPPRSVILRDLFGPEGPPKTPENQAAADAIERFYGAAKTIAERVDHAVGQTYPEWKSRTGEFEPFDLANAKWHDRLDAAENRFMGEVGAVGVDAAPEQETDWICTDCGLVSSAPNDEAVEAAMELHDATPQHDRNHEAVLRNELENARTALYDYLKSKGRVA